MNYNPNSMYGDLLQNLPTNQDKPNNNDKELFDKLFPEKQSNINLNEVKKIVIMSFIFLVLSIDNTNNLISRILPEKITNNPNKIVLIKFVIFIVAMIIVYKVI